MEPTALSGVSSLLPDSYLTGLSHFPDPDGLELEFGSLSFSLALPVNGQRRSWRGPSLSLQCSYLSYPHRQGITVFALKLLFPPLPTQGTKGDRHKHACFGQVFC